jgi:hypothetical protein
MLKVIYGLSNSHLELASKSIKNLVKTEAHDMDIVDSLALHDALLLCSRLEKFGAIDRDREKYTRHWT